MSDDVSAAGLAITEQPLDDAASVSAGEVADLRDRVERLNRRLSRERAARQAAEETAEQGLAELYAQNRRLDRQVERRTRELEEARERAENALQSSTTFLANLSHDLRTPINGILGMLELLRASVTEDEHVSLITTANESAERLSRLMNRLLMYVDLDRWLKTDLTGIDVNPVLEEAVSEWARRALSAGQLLTSDSTVSSDALVRIDGHLLRFLLDELIGNAVEHGSPGAVRVEAEIDDQRRLRVTVADSGPGLSDEELKKYLEPFRHGEEDRRDANSGTGLGLPLVVKLAEVMNATVEFESSKGGSTRVHLRLPPNATWVDRAADSNRID